MDGNEIGKVEGCIRPRRNQALISNIMELRGRITNTQRWFQMQS